MKRKLFITTLALALSLLVYGGAALAQQQGGVQGQVPQGQGWFCPWCGQQYGQGQVMGPAYQGRGMGPGMMGPGMMYGRGMGPGMMGPGMMYGCGMGPGMMGPGMMYGCGMGPGMMYGHGMMRPGMMYGRGMGPGMTQERWGRGQYGPNRQQQQMEPLQKDAARNIAENYVAGNPNLNIGDIKEKDDVFVTTVVTKDGSLVEKLLIDKETGWMEKKY